MDPEREALPQREGEEEEETERVPNPKAPPPPPPPPPPLTDTLGDEEEDREEDWHPEEVLDTGAVRDTLREEVEESESLGDLE